jgi:hypothetical protein
MIKWRKSKEFGTGVSRAAPGQPGLWITLWITWINGVWSLEFNEEDLQI